MKLTTNNNTEDFGHKKFKFRIDESHAMKAIWALINLYEHKVRTPVQEVISNARDAHREVGKPDHTFDVKVTDNEFIVRDYGSGISPDKAENIFCSIGESTKTGDNNQTGGFGIGAKSPLAYTKQFEMYSYIDGIQYHYMIAKNGEMLDMNLVSTTKTNLKNGTKVVIPIKQTKDLWGRLKSDKDSFINAVRRCCYFWENRPNFNHEIQPMEVFRLKGMPNYGYYSDKVIDGTILVIDGIPYRVRSGRNIVGFFNTGDFRIHETRERLADNPDDSEYNNKKINEFLNKVETHIDRDVHLYVDKNNVIESLKKLKYYGIPFLYRHGNLRFDNRYIRRDNGNDFKLYKSKESGRYPYSRIYKKEDVSVLYYNTEVFYNDSDESQQKVSRRIKNYLQTYINEGKSHDVYVTSDKVLSTLFKAKKLSILELPKINRNGETKQNEQITITELRNYGQNRLYRKLDDVSKNYLYVGFDQEVSNSMINFLGQKGYSVCKLSKDNIDKVSTHEKFTEYYGFVENYKLTKDEVNKIYRDKLKTIYLKVNFTEVLDPKVKRLNDIDSKFQKSDVDYDIPNALFNDKIRDTINGIGEYNAEILDIRDYISKEYPLIGGTSEQITEYINALFSYRKNLHSEK